jgi:PAS domain S-box-containing protein
MMTMVSSLPDKEKSREQLLQELALYRSFFSSLQEGAGLGEIVLDPAGRPCDCRYVEVNEAFRRLTGLQAGDSEGRTIQELFPGLSPPWTETCSRVALSGRPARFESESSVRGQWFDIHVCCPGRGKLAVLFSDITERRRMEDDLKAAGERFQSILENAPSAICVARIEPPGEITYLNPKSIAVTGYDPADVPTLQDWYEKAFPDPGYREEVITGLRRDFEDGFRTRRAVYRVACRDGTVKDIQFRASLLPDGSLITFGNDVSELRRMEEELQAEKARARLNLDIAAVMFVALDTAGKVTLINRRGQELLGYTQEELLGRDWFETCIPERLRDEMKGFFRGLLAGQAGPTGYHENPVICKDGTERIVAWNNGVIRGPEGRAAGILGSGEDVTERKRMEEALRESETRFHSMVENALDGIVLTDEQGTVIEWNPAQERITGLRRGDAIGRPLWEVQLQMAAGVPKTAATLDQVKAATLPLLATGRLPPQTQEMERKILRADGEPRTVHSMAFSMKTARGFRLGGIVRDTTDRKRAEEALRASEERFRQYFSLGLVGMAIESPTGGWIEVNDRLCEIYGYPREELMKRHWMEITHPEDLDKDVDQFHRLLRGEISQYAMEKRYLHRSGETIHCMISIGCSRGPGGEVATIFALVMDITQRKKAEEALRQSEERLRSFNERLEQQIAERTAVAEKRTRQLQVLALQLSEAEERERRRISGILHDELQQLLVGAKYKLDLLNRSTRIDEELRQGILRLNSIVDESIRKARNLSHEISPPVLYREGLVGALEWLARRMNTEYGLEVLVQAKDPVRIENEVFRVFLFRAVQELLFNVVKHSGVKEASVLLASPNGRLEIAVADRGRGFDPQALQQAGSPSRGVGLYSIMERISFLGGSLRIESTPRQGSRFVLSVPISETPPASRQGELDFAASHGAAAASPAPGRATHRVLLADDHQVVRQGLVSLLNREADIRVVGEASNGLEVVEMTRRLRPDVVVMDVAMPEMDGFEATRRIRQEMPNVRVIGLSLYEEEGVAERLIRSGAEAYLGKAGPSENLIAAIRGGTGEAAPAGPTGRPPGTGK